jgi:hypothetical protein
MSRKLTKLVDTTATSAVSSVVGDFNEFKNKVMSMLEQAEGILLEHYRNVKIIENIHAINDIQALYDFKVQPVPREAMGIVARNVEAAYGTDPMHVQIQIYLEVMSQLHAAGVFWIQEQVKQRVQALATLQSKKGSRIIIPPSNIIT